LTDSGGPQGRRTVCVVSHGKRSKLNSDSVLAGGFFDDRAIFPAYVFARGKSHPDLFLDAAAQIQTPVGWCIVVEDTRMYVPCRRRRRNDRDRAGQRVQKPSSPASAARRVVGAGTMVCGCWLLDGAGAVLFVGMSGLVSCCLGSGRVGWAARGRGSAWGRPAGGTRGGSVGAGRSSG
jgi:hypothetical protein